MSNPSNAKTQTTEQTPFTNPFTQPYAETMMDLMAIQIRGAQTLIEKSMSLGQAMTNHIQAQMSEGLKFSQECAKQSWTVSEAMKKSAFEAADRAFRPGTSA